MLDATVYIQHYNRSNRCFYALLHKNMIYKIYMSNEEHKNIYRMNLIYSELKAAKPKG